MVADEKQTGTCWYRVLTAPGPGAVAVIELNCERPGGAQFVLRRIVSATRHPFAMSIGRICYGRWNAEDLIVVRVSETQWEIQCHGGAIALNRICDDLVCDGVLKGDELDPTTLISGDSIGSDAAQFETLRLLVRREIQNRLANARTRKMASFILAQATNSLHSDLKTLLDSEKAETPEAAAIRTRLSGWKDIADHLTKPWRVVLAGAPNVGKSSLMNAIAGMERSIVCNQPGTTRDVVEVDTVIDGWPFRIVDTAGLRADTKDEIEGQGIQLSHQAASQCDVLCLIVDGNSGIADWSEQMPLATLPKNTVIVQNKSDLLAEAESIQASFRDLDGWAALPVISVSALTGEGLSTLLQRIRQSVVPLEPTTDTALPLCGISPKGFLCDPAKVR